MAHEYTILTVGGQPERFDDFAADHGKWRATASHLLAAAELLWPTIEASFRANGENPDDPAAAHGLRYRGPFYLLVGLAVENLANALIVQAKNRRGERVTNGDTLAPDLDGKHNLNRLVRDAGFTPTDVEDAMLDRLSLFVKWRGRFPVPKRRADIQKETVTSTTDMRQIRRLFERLEKRYRAETQGPA